MIELQKASEVDGKKYRRGSRIGGLHAWQEAALVEDGRAVFVQPKQPKPKKATSKKASLPTAQVDVPMPDVKPPKKPKAE